MRTQRAQNRSQQTRSLKAFAIIFAAVVVLLGLLGVYVFVYLFGGGPMSPQEKRFQQAFLRAKESGRTPIYLKDLTDFDWDRVCAFYTGAMQPDELVAELGFRFEGYDSLRWLDLEEFWGLFFIRGSTDVIPIRVRESIGTYYGGAPGIDPPCVERTWANLVSGNRGWELHD